MNHELTRLERVAQNRPSLWVAVAFSLLGQLGFVLLFNLLLPSLGSNLGQAGRILLGLLFSLVPGGLWLYFFYRQDAVEPEPKRMVLGVFMVGALLTAALYQPVLQGIFTVDGWLLEHWWTHLLGGILIVGFFEQFLVYLAVRFAVFEAPEFDERVDGVIYAIAAGLGFATVINFAYVVKHGGVDLDVGSIRMVINALAHACFAGIFGYFIGQSKFETTPWHYLPMGMAISAGVNGLFTFLLERTGSGGLSYNPWPNLILCAILAVAVLLFVFWLVARANEETLRVARATHGTSAPASQSSSLVVTKPATQEVANG